MSTHTCTYIYVYTHIYMYTYTHIYILSKMCLRALEDRYEDKVAWWQHARHTREGFPGGDMSRIPGPGRFHMLLSNEARVPHLLSLCSRAQKLLLLSPHATTTEAWALQPVLRNKRSHHSEKSTHHLEQPPLPTTGEKATQQWRFSAVKNK